MLLNVALAQAIVFAFYPNAGTRLGPVGLGALCLLVVISGVSAARGWRSYLRRPPAE